ncbi:preprotein translocase subunit SecG [Lacinutrix neustonica]|uniref:Protein-export membrane protein SecG n=1 Tax=Lacinutrix neustonica TaxID=2980107 RepID=A0A9E8MWH1_9FLAO|nr:preprotein translocase subunit SecG [Lacinutrix neustonica]WAC01559.1 preprotein translocase subunit SecG [Lacinutrix neustonica]
MGQFTIFLALIVVVAFLLIVVIMVQNPKGGGLSSSFGGGGTQQLGGVKKTTDFLDKSTWTLSTILVVLILLSSLAIPRAGIAQEDSTALDPDALETPAPAAVTPNTNDTAKPADSTK